ncbi:MAG: cyclic nucleotide-binding domain-containing protein, partial [Polyangiales bacterium]
ATRPSSGLANAARRISETLTGKIMQRNDDLAAQLDTRQRPRIELAEAERLSRPPPTVPFQRADLDDDDDAETPAPGVEHREEDQTQPREMPGTRTRAPTSSVLTTQFFAPLPVERRAQILQRFQRRAVPAGSTIIRQGETAHPLVLVSKGRLDVRVERADGQIIQVGTVALGEYVGEVALLHRVPAMANVIAAGDVEILALPPRDFYEIAGAFPALWAELKDVAERRQREYDFRLRAGR